MCFANALKSRDHPQKVESRELPPPKGTPSKGNHGTKLESSRVKGNIAGESQGKSSRNILKKSTEGKYSNALKTKML